MNLIDLLGDVAKDAPWVADLIRANEEAPKRRTKNRRVKPEADLVNYQFNAPNVSVNWSVGGLQLATEAEKRKKKFHDPALMKFWYSLQHSVRNEFGGFEQFVTFTPEEKTETEHGQSERVEAKTQSNQVLFEIEVMARARLALEFAGEGGHFVTIDGRPVFISDGPARSAVKLQHGQTTKDAFYKNGEWSAEREKIHDDTAEGYIQGKHAVVGRKPIAHVLGGGTASGKTTASEAILGHNPNVVRIDPDELKLAVPEYESLKAEDKSTAALRVHDESKAITQKLLAKAMSKNLDLTYDATTSGKTTGPAMVDTLVKHGYDVRLNFVDLPVEVAMRRSELRAKGDNPINKGRVVPESIIRETHSDSAQRFLELKEHPGITSAKLYDNSQPRGESPTLVYERRNQNGQLGQATIHNAVRWQQYLRKASGAKE